MLVKGSVKAERVVGQIKNVAGGKSRPEKFVFRFALRGGSQVKGSFWEQ